jgi:hypothetical protein
MLLVPVIPKYRAPVIQIELTFVLILLPHIHQKKDKKAKLKSNSTHICLTHKYKTFFLKINIQLAHH